jgi:hypothetical protein
VGDRTERDSVRHPVVTEEISRGSADLLLSVPRPEDSLARVKEVRMLPISRFDIRENCFRGRRISDIKNARSAPEHRPVSRPEIVDHL